MKRYVLCLALVSFGFGSFTLPALAASAEAKKACSAQWDAEKKAKTIPRGMTHEKYMKQCTTNYAANMAPPPTPPAEQGTTASTAWPPAPGQ
jgi:hypothetical protein